MSPLYSLNLNGMAERANRRIKEPARSMLEHASLHRKFWAETVFHAARILNTFFCPRNKDITSDELMTDRKPDVSYLRRVFGSLFWYHIKRERCKKLDPKSELGILIACLEHQRYKLWIPSRNVAVFSRDVTIVEDNFPGAQLGRNEQGLGLIEDVGQNGTQTAKHLSSPTTTQAPRDVERRTFLVDDSNSSKEIHQMANTRTQILSTQ